MSEALDWMRNPENYVECRFCNGHGSSLHEVADRCSKCGGNGCFELTVDIATKYVKEDAELVWQQIAFDVIQSNGGKSMKADQVAEIVIDKFHFLSTPEGKKAYKYLKKKSHELFVLAVEKAFSEYEWWGI